MQFSDAIGGPICQSTLWPFEIANTAAVGTIECVSPAPWTEPSDDQAEVETPMV